MDGSRFDGLTQQLGMAVERRGGRRALLAVAVAFMTGIRGLADATSATKGSPRQKTKAEACIPTGKHCPSKKPRGKKGKKLSCDQCCQRHVETSPNGKRVCACQPNGLPCAATRECCSGVCTGGVCQATPCGACPAGQECVAGACACTANVCPAADNCHCEPTVEGSICLGSSPGFDCASTCASSSDCPAGQVCVPGDSCPVDHPVCASIGGSQCPGL